MKILFVNPSLRGGMAGHLYLPVGLGYVMTYVKEHGHDFELLDIDAGGYDNEYINRFLKAWSVSLPVALLATTIVAPLVEKFVDKITK